jgi:hypothetical protein
MSWSSPHTGVQIKPKLFISATLYNELVCQDSKKLEGAAVKAEAMGGDGDIPVPTAFALLVNDQSGPEGGIIVQKELARPVDVSADPTRADLDVQPGTIHSCCHDGHKSCPSAYYNQAKIADNASIPLIKGKPWYFLGPPAD